MGEAGEVGEFLSGGAGVDGSRGDGDCFRDAIEGDFSDSGESGGGIGENNGARGSGLSAENAGDDGGGFGRRTDFQLLGLDFREIEVCGSPMEFAEGEITFDDEGQRFAPEGDFIELAGTADDDGARAAEISEGLGEESGGFMAADAEELVFGGGGVCQRSDEIEDCAEAELFADGGDVFHRGMKEGGEAEAEAELIDAGTDLFG